MKNSLPELTSSCPFCDELDAGLMCSKADSEKMMEAVVRRMLAEY